MLRNSGAVGNWVPPMGGRVHRTIEQKIRDTINPEAAPMAMQRRMFTSGTPDARTYLSELSSLPQEGLWQRLSRKTRGVVNPRRLWGTAALAATIAPIALMSYSRHVAKQKAMAMGSGASALPGQEEQKVANALLGAAYAGMTPASTVMNEAFRRRAVEEGLADPDNPHAKTNLYGTLGASALGLGAGYALTGVRKGNIIPAVMSSMASTLTNAYLGGKMDGHDMGWRNARFRGDVRRAVETPEAHVPAPASSTMSAMYASEAPWMRDVTTRIAKREKPLALDHYVLKRDLDPETYAKVREVFK